MKAAILSGAVWMVLFRFADRSLGIISTLLLARLLMPADFGLVAMAMSVIAMIELATSFGFESALIQMAIPRRQHYDTAWTLNVLFGAGCALIVAALAIPAASFYAEPRLTIVMFVLALGLLATAFENIGTVEFRRSMNFQREFVFLASKRTLSFAVTIALAVVFRSYWALVAGMVTSRLAGVALSFSLHSYRPRFNLEACRELFSFSGWMLANNIISAVLIKIPHFFVGRFEGSHALGAYTVGSELAFLPSTEIVAPINRAVFPGYSRLVENKDAFRQTFVDVLGVVFLLALPASTGVALLAGPLVRVLLGEAWIEAVPIVQVLSFVGAIMSVTSNNFSAYFALGRTGLPPIILGLRALVMILALFFLVRHFGMVGAAWAELLGAVASLAVSIPILLRILQISLRSYVAVLWRPMIASALMSLAVDAALRVVDQNGSLANAALSLVGGSALGVLAYSLTAMLLWLAAGRPRGPESQLLALVIERVRALRGDQRQ